MNRLNFSKHLEIKDVKINDKFWNEIIRLVKNEVIPYQHLALQDKIEGAEKSFCIDNFIKAKAVKHKILQGSAVKKYPVDKWHYTEENSEPESFKGWVFQDSDVYKWIEAVGYSLQNFPDTELERKALEYIDIICDAQLENGYLDTLYIINDIDKAFTNLKDHHELYCFGHLAEGAVSFYNATGNDKLLKTACRFADLICDTFGENKIKGYDGHEICEMALFKLYKTTGRKKYLDTALFFINERGKQPYYYDKETGVDSCGENYHYNQAHIPPRKQTEAVGHAVRGVYLYSAMADLAKELNDDELKKACESIWNNIENKKMYITGGIGATVDGEAFSFDYDLPNDLAYAETCASIGLIFFARRMSEMSIDSKYSDTIERALYNTVLSGMGEDGKSFFYVNPLEVLPLASHSDSRKQHIKPVRQKWFGCACCPPNLARLISSLNEYIYNENDNTIFVNQYICSNAVTKYGSIELKEDNGNYNLITDFSDEVKIALRIPYWCDNFELNHSFEIINGYAFFTATNENVQIKLNAKPKIIKCSNRVRANIGKAAVTYGPFIYCLEEADNGCDLQMLSIDISKQPTLDYDIICAEGYREAPDNKLYMNYCEPRKEKCTLKFIPYYKWGNRGENEMCIYVRVLNEKEL